VDRKSFQFANTLLPLRTDSR